MFQQRIMTQDKLFGAAAAYLMIGVLWAYLYAIIGFFFTGALFVAILIARLVGVYPPRESYTDGAVTDDAAR